MSLHISVKRADHIFTVPVSATGEVTPAVEVQPGDVVSFQSARAVWSPFFTSPQHFVLGHVDDLSSMACRHRDYAAGIDPPFCNPGPNTPLP